MLNKALSAKLPSSLRSKSSEPSATAEFSKLDKTGRRKIDQWRSLSEQDSISQTVGCRHSNPDICRNHSTERKCAFVREDKVCQLPPKSWAAIFEQLKSGARRG